MLNRRLSLMLQPRNMYGHTIYDNTSESVHQFKYSSLECKAHVVILTFSYRFNNFKVKGTEDDSSSTKEQGNEERSIFLVLEVTGTRFNPDKNDLSEDSPSI